MSDRRAFTTCPLPGQPRRFPDVENFVKPVLDAAAAGLFCPTTVDPNAIVRWDYDDSNFRTLLVHRLPDATEAGDEGVALLVSCR